MAYDSKDLKPKTENPYEDLEAISRRIDKAYEVDKFHRTLFEREWFRNILFMIGQQWIIYDGSRWRSKRLPPWYPRAQTNKFSEKSNDLIATLIQTGRIPIRYSPSNQDPVDIATAEIGESLREVMYTEAGIDDKAAEMATWLISTGNVFLLSYYDPSDKYGTTPMPQQRCMACGAASPALDVAAGNNVCPACMSPAGFTPAVDPEGAELVDEVPVGALQADIVSPFELRIDHRITRMEDQQRFVRVKRYDLGYARDRWRDARNSNDEPVLIEGDGNSDVSQFYLDILSHATANFSGSGSAIGADTGSGKHERVTAYELYELPSEDYPEGLHAIRIGSNTQAMVHVGPQETQYGAGKRQGQKFLNLVHFGFDTVPGRFWKKTRMDDVVPLQMFRNVVEANLRLTAQRMGNAIWLKPKGSGADIITGEPGQVVEYNPVTMGGTSFAKPERMDAALGNMQPLIMLINKIDDSIERVSGTFFLQGGDTPPGVTAASALAYLGERAQRSMSPLLREWAKGWRRWEMQALEIVRANWTDDRIRIIAGRNKQWETQVFKQADLMGGVEMDIDYNGLMPKSNATDRAEVGQLIQFHVINPQDPQQNYNILKLFGKTELLGTVDLDTKEATKENECFMVPDDQPEHKEPELIPLVQNSQIHIAIHSDLCKTDEWKTLDVAKKQRWIMHIQGHVQDAVAYQQQMLMLQQAASMPPGMQAAAQQNGGVPNGATAPDPRLQADGTKQEPQQPTADPGAPAMPADMGIQDVMPAADVGVAAA